MCADLVSPQERIRGRHETLSRYGIAAEPFPGYVNPVLDHHELDVVLLTFVLAGEGHHVMDGIDHLITGPSFAITRTGEKHGLITGDRPLDVVNVYLDVDDHPLPSLRPPLDLALATLIPLGASTASRIRLPQVSLDDVDDTRALLRMIVAETNRPHDGTGEAMDALKKLILVTCARLIADRGFIPDTASLGRAHSAIETVRVYLDRNYVDTHTLESLASMAHLERTYFSRMFARYTGSTVTDYVAQLRVQYAMTQLRGGDRPISDIAVSSGFRDLSHFGRVFRKHSGTTPREYRRRHSLSTVRPVV
ncbi:AraC family transcriptional regulator [Microbacterium murale]|nr:AraC family transcriptional regulator [Microbacterium murale]